MKKKKNKKKTFVPKQFYWLITAAFLILSAIFIFLLFYPQEEVRFNFSGDPFMWNVSAGASAEAVMGSLKVYRNQSDYCYMIIPNVNINANEYDLCEIKLSLPIAFEQGELFFISPYNRNFDQKFMLPYYTGPAGSFNRAYVDLKRHPAWQGYIPAVLILFPMQAESCAIKEIKFVRSNWNAKISAIWSDFTHYYDPKLGTCFGMASPVFLDSTYQSFSAPILWGLLCICLIALFCINVFKMNHAFRVGGIIVFTVIFFVFAGILDLRNNVYYIRSIQRNLNLYAGKSADEKRGTVIGDMKFVQFMRFCDEKVPPDAKIVNRVAKETPFAPVDYLAATQVSYLLRPRTGNLPGFAAVSPEAYYIYYYSSADSRLKIRLRFNNEAFIMKDAEE